MEQIEFPFRQNTDITSKPRIALCPDWRITADGLKIPRAYLYPYIKLLTQLGAEVFVTHFFADTQELAKEIDGWLIPGSHDIHPSTYNADFVHKKTHMSPCFKDRFAFDTKMFKDAHPNMPILGINYGCQFLNVIQGGTLIQHLDAAACDHDGVVTKFKVLQDSLLGDLLGANVATGRCFHHQGIGILGRGVRLSVYDESGLIHGIELDDRNRTVSAVLWHPERTLNYEENMELLRNFVRKCKEYKEYRFRNDVVAVDA